MKTQIALAVAVIAAFAFATHVQADEARCTRRVCYITQTAVKVNSDDEQPCNTFDPSTMFAAPVLADYLDNGADWYQDYLDDFGWWIGEHNLCTATPEAQP